jgi:hypothetical protein
MAQSSDELIKREIIDEVGYTTAGCKLRVFPEGSNDDQKLVEEGGLTFSHNKIPYGSCDAGWFYKVEEDYVPYIGLEATDALNRGSSGNAQYQRFHHALGAVKEGFIGVYYLRKGNSVIQPDLYGMAVNATEIEKGVYIITDDLEVIKSLLEFRADKQKLNSFIESYIEKMKKIYTDSFNARYKGDWDNFARRRSTIIEKDYVIKHAARMVRNFTDSSQRAGHIAVGEMFLTKYFFPNKKFYYLFPKMTKEDIAYLDRTKGHDKEWFLLRNEPNVEIVPIDRLNGVSKAVIEEILLYKDEPSKAEALKAYNRNVKIIMQGLKDGVVTIS